MSAARGRRVVRLFRLEVTRFVRRPVFWASVVVLGGIAGSNMVLPASPDDHLFGAFTHRAVRDSFVFALAVFVGVVVAGSLAADRRRGIPSLMLVRGISRRWYLAVKAAAMATSAGAGVGLSCMLAYAAASLFLIWGGPSEVPTDLAGPYPGLLAAHPLAGDLVLVAVLSTGAGGLALSGLAFGAVVANEYLAAAVPVVILVAGVFVFRTPALLFLGPYTELSLGSSYTYALPRWAWSFTAPVYWAVFATVCMATAEVIAARREEV